MVGPPFASLCGVGELCWGGRTGARSTGPYVALLLCSALLCSGALIGACRDLGGGGLRWSCRCWVLWTRRGAAWRSRVFWFWKTVNLKLVLPAWCGSVAGGCGRGHKTSKRDLIFY